MHLCWLSFWPVFTVAAHAEEAGRRLLTAADINALHAVADPQVSPDGDWVAYTVRTSDLVQDKRTTHVWMASWDGERQVQLTSLEGQRGHAALEPRWALPGVSVGARR